MLCPKGVNAKIVETRTFDAFMLHLWRNVPNRSDLFDSKVRQSSMAKVDIPIPEPGKGSPVLRMTRLLITRLPEQCHSLSFGSQPDWKENH